MAQWFKFFAADFMSDPKMVMLSDREIRCWITLLCLAGNSYDSLSENVTESNEEVTEPRYGRNGESVTESNGKVTQCNGGALQRLSNIENSTPEDCEKILIKFEKMGLIKREGDDIIVINFLKRQAPTLSNAERQAKFRGKKKSNEEVTEPRYGRNEEVTPRVEESRIERGSTKRPSGVGGEPRPEKPRGLEPDKTPNIELRNQALDLINHWAASWEKTFGKKADITSWGRYLKQAMPLVKANGLDPMKALCDKYFLLFDDKLVKENQWPLGLFLTDGVINKLKNQ